MAWKGQLRKDSCAMLATAFSPGVVLRHSPVGSQSILQYLSSVTHPSKCSVGFRNKFLFFKIVLYTMFIRLIVSYFVFKIQIQIKITSKWHTKSQFEQQASDVSWLCNLPLLKKVFFLNELAYSAEGMRGVFGEYCGSWKLDHMKS